MSGENQVTVNVANRPVDVSVEMAAEVYSYNQELSAADFVTSVTWAEETGDDSAIVFEYPAKAPSVGGNTVEVEWTYTVDAKVLASGTKTVSINCRY